MLKTTSAFLFLILISLFLMTSVNATPADSGTLQTESFKLNPVQAIKTVASDGFTLMFTPFHWQKKEWLSFGALSTIAVGLYTRDAQINRWFVRNKHSTGENLADFGDYYGGNFWTASIWSGCYIGGYLFNNPKLRRMGAVGVESVIITSALVMGAKYLSQRRRPIDGYQPEIWWNEFDTSLESQSFPSGHTAIAFCLAAVLSSEFEGNKIIPIIGYGLAALTGISRLNVSHHWASDVFCGGVLGYFATKSVIGINRTRNIQINPQISTGNIGMNLSINLD